MEIIDIALKNLSLKDIWNAFLNEQQTASYMPRYKTVQ